MNETLRTVDGSPVLRIERRLNHPVERVWKAVTEPDQFSQWYPFTVVQMDFRVDGRILFDDGAGTSMEATIVEIEPPRVFAFSEKAPEQMSRESRDLVRIELRSDGGGCLLIFTHTFDDRPAAASYATGWNACLDGLAMLLAEAPVEIDIDWARRHEEFAEKFGLSEASIEESRDEWTVRFERQLTKPVDDVWAALAGGEPINGTTPEGFTVEDFTTGQVVRVDEPKMLVFEWLYDDRPVGQIRWELTEGTGHGARLLLTQTGPAGMDGERARAEKAWKQRIERLARHLAGLEE
jgi:uncharacterized protein YndB with AHSA1/START domain